MAEYLVIIYGNEESLAQAGDETMGKLMADHNSFGEANGANLRGGNALEGSSTATSLRKNSSGDIVTTDGPFAETKEAIGGYYVIEANDLDAALAIAKQVPMPFGGVEVRPIRNMA
ncbi:MAG: YciI family protein [Acidimicrobiales bacterium]